LREEGEMASSKNDNVGQLRRHVFLIVIDDEVEAPLRGLVGYLPASDLARRKTIPAVPIKPVLRSNNDEGSGVGAMF